LQTRAHCGTSTRVRPCVRNNKKIREPVYFLAREGEHLGREIAAKIRPLNRETRWKAEESAKGKPSITRKTKEKEESVKSSFRMGWDENK